MEKFFRIKYGYGKDEFLSISEDELPRAVKAQGDGSVALFAEGTIAGNNIMAITPDYNRMLGYNPEYRMTGEDYDEIPRRLLLECLKIMETAKLLLAAPNQARLK